MVESGGGSGVSDSLEVNLGIVGETSVDAPLSQHLFFALYFNECNEIHKGRKRW